MRKFFIILCVIGVVVFLAFVTLAILDEPRPDKNSESSVFCSDTTKTCKIFDATLKRTYEPRNLDPTVDGESIIFVAHKTGSYMIESWRERYRNTDICDTLLSFIVDTLPFTKIVKFNTHFIEGGTDTWRVEITWYDNSTKLLKRKTVHIN